MRNHILLIKVDGTEELAAADPAGPLLSLRLPRDHVEVPAITRAVQEQLGIATFVRQEYRNPHDPAWRLYTAELLGELPT